MMHAESSSTIANWTEPLTDRSGRTTASRFATLLAFNIECQLQGKWLATY